MTLILRMLIGKRQCSGEFTVEQVEQDANADNEDESDVNTTERKE